MRERSSGNGAGTLTTPKIDRLIEKLLDPSAVADLPSLLGRFDTVLAEQSA